MVNFDFDTRLNCMLKLQLCYRIKLPRTKVP